MGKRLSEQLRSIVVETEAPVVVPGSRRAQRQLMTEAERATKGRGCQVRRDTPVGGMRVVIEGLEAAKVAAQVARRFQGGAWRAVVTTGRGSATVQLVSEAGI